MENTSRAGRLAGRVALITGAARGQGRSHAVRIAEEGGDVIALDVARDLGATKYGLATPDDLAETVDLVEAAGGRAFPGQVDVRDVVGLGEVVTAGVEEFGRLDIVVANAAIAGNGTVTGITQDEWQNMIDVNLTGVWNTIRATVDHLSGPTGSIVLVNSIAGLKGLPLNSHYTAAKHGVIGLMRCAAAELGPQGIRVNAVLPTTVATPMLHNPAVYRLFVPGVEEPTREQAVEVMRGMHVLPIAEVEPVDISNAVVFLSSDEARYITGVLLPVDGGALIK
jgi:SDR family mycofactocin-dependent oxidoreductase